MDIVTFIKSHLSTDSEFGDLAKDIQGDKEFPINQPEEAIISYLNFKTSMGGTNDTFQRFIRAYEKQKLSTNQSFNIDSHFSLFATEVWSFYKEHFPCDKVILIGEPFDIYKVYCIDSERQKALYIDLKSLHDINDVPIVEEERINRGHLTKVVSVRDAIQLLGNCSYHNVVKPNSQRYEELMEYLNINN